MSELMRRLMRWICKTFGHSQYGNGETEWTENGHWHYQCLRCGKNVSMKAED